MRALAQHSPFYTMTPAIHTVSPVEDFGHVFQQHAQCFLGRRRAHWREIGDVCSQTFPLAQKSSIDFHRVQNFAHTIETSFSCLLLLSARRVTLHLFPEGRPVRANLTCQSVATDKVRGYLVQPFARHIQLCQHFLFDRARRFTHLVLSCRTRLWDFYVFRERSLSDRLGEKCHLPWRVREGVVRG